MMFVRYENLRSYIRLYPITSLILIINVALFIVDFVFLDREITIWGMFYQEHVFNRYGFEEPYRFVTSIALHAGWEHLLFNCFSILVFAPPLERLLGHLRYLAFYLVAGIGGNVLSAFVHAGSDYSSVGASGAIYGVFGCYLFLAIFHKNALDDGSRKTVYATLIFGLIYSVLMPGINIWAHIGGAITGIALMGQWSLLRGRKQLEARLRNY
ncbi:rhomboid family intramembrane serine protease [Cohnella lupini]|uniref:Membrane associated rhomboid family serine protease n=1 Tax=Cohnella lupini TaxID=1294267 RepID=A0A3D9IC13_9BACL|nr:rhomboid family intramembrane serine protease [Cohnella lupini]RED59195.1 membrane associated rhomboid family serine protease [Cohnella lupini]